MSMDFTLIPGVLSVRPLERLNEGAAFGILQGAQVFLIIMTFVILAAGIFLYFRFEQGRGSKLFNIGCAFVLGGALGNLTDRIFLPGVRDFICFDFFDFPIFNLADVFLNVGMVLLAVYFLFVYKGTKHANVQG